MLRESQGYLLPDTVCTTCTVNFHFLFQRSVFVADVSRTRNDDNLPFCAFRIYKQLIVRDDSGHDGSVMRRTKKLGSTDVVKSSYGRITKQLNVRKTNFYPISPSPFLHLSPEKSLENWTRIAPSSAQFSVRLQPNEKRFYHRGYPQS